MNASASRLDWSGLGMLDEEQCVTALGRKSPAAVTSGPFTKVSKRVEVMPTSEEASLPRLVTYKVLGIVRPQAGTKQSIQFAKECAFEHPTGGISDFTEFGCLLPEPDTSERPTVDHASVNVEDGVCADHAVGHPGAKVCDCLCPCGPAQREVVLDVVPCPAQQWTELVGTAAIFDHLGDISLRVHGRTRKFEVDII
jgi:hypothetical protein